MRESSWVGSEGVESVEREEEDRLEGPGSEDRARRDPEEMERGREERGKKREGG